MRNSDQPITPTLTYIRTVIDGIVTEDTKVNHLGLTKREYFAAMAMQGILANSEFLRNNKDINIEETAIRCADDLLSALSTTTDKIE